MTAPPEPRRPLRLALVGCGDIGVLRAAAIARTPGLELAVACDTDHAKAEAVASKSTGATATTDWHDAVRSSAVDAVVISTPPALHLDMCVAAFAAGKHVLCEKPLARSPAECRAIVDAARHAGAFLATGFNYRFYPSFAKARELLQSGIIGDLDHVRAYGGYSATSHNQPWVHDAATVGGGALRDIGIHLIDLTRDVLGDVVEVTGAATGDIWNYPGCEDNGFALLRNSRGRVATVQASWTEWRKYQFRIEIVGSRGCIEATCFPMMTRVTWSAERAGPTRRKTDWFPRTAIGEKTGTYRWVVVESFVREFQAFLDYVSGRPSRIATGEDGARAVEIAFQATREFSETAPPDGIDGAHQARAGSSPPSPGTPRLSVVVLPFGASDIAPCLNALMGQGVNDLEVIVAHDDSLADVGGLVGRFPAVRFLGRPGVRPPAELRALGAASAGGDIVAFLEAHCTPSANWCAALLRAHRQPHAAIGGPIEKGMPHGRNADTALNWAIYLSDYSRYMLPLPEGPMHGLSDCNVSYKRSALEATRALWQTGFHENVMHDAIRGAGGVLWFDPGMVVTESRELRLGDALRDRFSFGRLFGSTRVAGQPLSRRVAMGGGAALMAPLLVLRVVRTAVARRRHLGQVLRSAPQLLLVAGSWMAGEATGYFTGRAGSSLTSGAEPVAESR
jgi:predicted dehydrogenase